MSKNKKKILFFAKLKITCIFIAEIRLGDRRQSSFDFDRINPSKITVNVINENKMRKYKISPAGCVLIVRSTNGKNPHTKKAITADT